jgi:eukaryotic-like serine/threonine-protein kinase
LIEAARLPAYTPPVDEPGSKMPPEPTLGNGRYIIGRELGRGTMGVVFEAEDTALGRTVAVKTIELAFAVGQEARREFEQRFFTEARVAARLSHPGIVVCHDVGKDPDSGKLFIVFEYLKGRTLADRVAEGPLAWRDALDVVVRVARAIDHAHEHGVVHRDLKPANIMLLDPRTGAASAARGEAAVKIMDFGVARLESLGPRLTGPGQSFGSPLYMAPEQALGEASSARSDIFSLGSVLCTLLLGRPWFDAPSIPEIVARVVHDDAPRVSRVRSDVPAALDAVVAAALAKRGEDRYATAAHMAEDLENVLAGGSARHAGTLWQARGPAEDPLLDGLVPPLRAAGRAAAPDATDALASLLDDAEPAHAAAAPRTAPAAAARRWRAPAAASIALAVIAAAALLYRPRPTRVEPAPSPSGPPPSAEVLPATPSPAPTTMPTAEAVLPAASPLAPSSAASPAAPSSVPVALEASPSPRAAPSATAAPATADRTRMRLSVQHPFENGRLIVWIDGVLVFESKLQATTSKRIVAIKVREGRVETILDVEPGPHDVRVEVTWDQERRVATKRADMAPGATGLLDVRVGRMSKDLTLQWSRLARD